MGIAWHLFTPWHSLAGGALIGLAASLLLLGNGQIAGISGILGNLLKPEGRAPWRLAFLAGLVLAPLLLWPVMLQITPSPVATPELDSATLIRLLTGGFLVGLGTRFANGCTSGHGVCGLARLSPRSLVAVLSFMGAGFVTVALWRLVNGGVSL
ncbi:MAG: YeeE/YedE [Haliea sp.]|uniref:YeeE/YedE family protein n=1 Tax=Haliea sp. TaxID=1932666 RepID=UPI000C4F0AFB|nr:YeeE/YedE family protein [Haliea sp.]MBM70389.1 YeeE/YedE [Haliea sp.]|tara:strand:+ start:1357 stop:1818 length:462 start_codon:yes stop_codon:yes gene_type:complete